jgi:hypothetical protein
VNFHPFSEVFPLLEGAPFEELADDIKAHGLREKIWLYDGKILDGRNRFLACRKAKIDPQFRKYTGKDPLAFVVSVNIQRRHLDASQRAMAAARIATLRHGQRADLVEEVPIGTSAATLNVGVRSVKRARKVLEEGSKDLQQAVAQGAVSVSKAAQVLELPKGKQLAAAIASPEEDEGWEPEENEEARLEAIERELAESVDRVMQADDKLAAAYAEIKRQAAEIAVLKLSRDGYMNGKAAVTKLLKACQRKVERLERRA